MVVLLLLRICVSILKFGELDQTSSWLCQSCRGISTAVHLLRNPLRAPLAHSSRSQGTAMQAHSSSRVWGQLSFLAFFP